MNSSLEFCNYQNLEDIIFIDMMKNNQNLGNNNKTASMRLVSYNRRLVAVIYD